MVSENRGKDHFSLTPLPVTRRGNFVWTCSLGKKQLRPLFGGLCSKIRSWCQSEVEGSAKPYTAPPVNTTVRTVSKEWSCWQGSSVNENIACHNVSSNRQPFVMTSIIQMFQPIFSKETSLTGDVLKSSENSHRSHRQMNNCNGHGIISTTERMARYWHCTEALIMPQTVYHVPGRDCHNQSVMSTADCHKQSIMSQVETVTTILSCVHGWLPQTVHHVPCRDCHNQSVMSTAGCHKQSIMSQVETVTTSLSCPRLTATNSLSCPM
jgi:hypothetical protein